MMSRKLYDLCRKYKYFYNKNKDVMEWDKKYHDIDLSDAIAKTRVDMGLVEHEIQKELFNIFDVQCESIDIETDMFDSFEVYIRNRLLDRHDPIPHHSSATIELRNGNRFLNVLSEYMRQDKYVWR